MSGSAVSLGALLRQASPDRLVEVANAYLRKYRPDAQLEVLLADYRISGLWPVLQTTHRSAGPLDDETAAVRSFASQEPVVEPGPDGGMIRVFLPLSVWGERVGVMVVDLLDGPTGEELWALAGMAEELALSLLSADHVTDRYRQVRRRQRLTMAAEMQWELLPGRALGGTAFNVAGQLEPAYQVCGDHFDWSLNDGRLTVTVLNGDGHGLAATMLTVVAVNAMRNARRSGANLVEQAGLAAEAVFTSYGGKHSVATVLMELDLANGVVSLIDAGSPRTLHMRGTQVTPVTVEHQLPLGMFPDTGYGLQQFPIEPGDRLFVVSDGVHAAAPPGRPAFGDRELTAVVRGTALQPAGEAVGNVMRGLHDYHEEHDLVDDAVIVCFDWLGADR